MSTFQINMHQALCSLSDALDLVGVTQIHHGKRVAFIAVECGKLLGWDEERMDDLFQAAILHDCGVSKTSVHAKLAQLQWEKEKEHCVLGAELVKTAPPLKHLSDIILHHHTHWDGFNGTAISPQEKILANCIYMADRVDILGLHALMEHDNLLLGRDEIIDKVITRSGTWFSPELVDVFKEVSNSDAFWMRLEGSNVNNYLTNWIEHDKTKEIEFDELKNVVKIFSHIVDAKSTFTREHSDGVAKLSRHMGELFNMSEHTCDILELAGFLHDLGKLRVPDEIIDKPGKLTPDEYSQIQRHSIDTSSILEGIKGFEDIALWASQHHERVNKTGYPMHQGGDEISNEARIIAVADVFQALAQDRPYRASMPATEVLGILKDDVASGKLDKTIVDIVEANLETCWNAAVN